MTSFPVAMTSQSDLPIVDNNALIENMSVIIKCCCYSFTVKYDQKNKQQSVGR